MKQFFNFYYNYNQLLLKSWSIGKNMFFQSLNLYSFIVAGLTTMVIVFMRQLSSYKQQIISKVRNFMKII
ncbi:MAG TPA: hypothetical protein LFW20_05215 [Rickettsia endosymbiont of Omalisus fontisbellaquei]|nr:hypothetical protein [Rickettsia endosymbiont of Omalisus fontisbellaquei]